MAETLESLFEKQRDFTSRVLAKNGFSLSSLEEKDKVFWTKEYAIALMKEITEVLDNIDWKHHQKRLEKTIVPNVVEELIDSQKYIWGLMSIWGMNSKDFVDAFNKKSYVVEERWRQENNVLSRPLALVDLDGVLCEYPESFLAWVRKNYPEVENLSKRENPILWEEMKRKYRLGGGKQEAIASFGAKEFLAFLKTRGWSVVVFTYRPIALFKNIEYDTIKWLEENGMKYDKIFWAGKEKSFYISSNVSECDLFIDDEEETCDAVASLGINVYCKNGKARNAKNFSKFEEVLRNEFGQE